MKDFIYERNKVVIGSSLESLLYAYRTNSAIFIKDPSVPFEFVKAEQDFSFLGFKEQPLLINVWNRLYILLSMGGLLLNPFDMQNWRRESNKLIMITPQSKKIVVRSRSFKVFDEPTDMHYVYDWFDVKSGGKHDLDLLENNEGDFIKKIIFFKSRRPNINRTKDAVAISVMSDKTLNDINYSEGIARLKTLDIMKKAGMRGTKNGVNKRGTPLYYALKIEHSYRESQAILEPSKTMKQVLKMKQKKEKAWKLTNDLFIQRTGSI